MTTKAATPRESKRSDDQYIHRSPLLPLADGRKKRFQQHAENLWERNAKDVAAEVDRLAVSQSLVVAGTVGDVGEQIAKLCSGVADESGDETDNGSFWPQLGMGDERISMVT